MLTLVNLGHSLSSTGREPLGAAVPIAPHCPVKHHNRNVCRLGYMHRYSLCKPCVHYFLSFHLRQSSYHPSDCCFSRWQESRDPRKLHWLFEMLMESPVNGEGGSFVDAWWVKSYIFEEMLMPLSVELNNLTLVMVSLSSRLYVLQGGLAQQEWRVPELLHRLLQYLEPKLTQVYKNVRERIGRWGAFRTQIKLKCVIRLL